MAFESIATYNPFLVIRPFQPMFYRSPATTNISSKGLQPIQGGNSWFEFFPTTRPVLNFLPITKISGSISANHPALFLTASVLLEPSAKGTRRSNG